MKGISGFVFPRMRVLAMAVAMGCTMAAGSVSAAEPSAIIQGMMIDKASSSGSAEPLDRARRIQGLIDKASTQGSVPVIVRLAVDTQLEALLSAPQIDDQRKQLSVAQDKVISALEAAPSRAVSSLQGLKRFAITPRFAVSVTADDLQLLRANPLVANIVEDYVMRPTLNESIPLIGGTHGTGFSGFTGAGWTVAILDTGVQKTHPFLRDKVISEACYSRTDTQRDTVSLCPGGVQSSTAKDSGVNCTGLSKCDHGTHVAGIVAGRDVTVSDRGSTFIMSGVAKDVNIISIKVVSRINRQSDCGITPAPCAQSFASDTVLGLERVLTLRDTFNIAAVNMSLGGGEFNSFCNDDDHKEIIDQLRAAGIATVTASGNDGFSSAVNAPSCVPSAVTVGSTTKLDSVAEYSNSTGMIDLLAPGSSIYSSIPTNLYAYYNGTSMAAPHVAGAFAVLKSAKPTATVSEIERALQNTGTRVLDARNNISRSRIQVAAALDALYPATPNKAKDDFDGDGKSDILWRNAVNGENWMWLMNGTGQSANKHFNTVTDLGWTVAAKGDFNGDGKVDIFWRKVSTGESWVYLMYGTSINVSGALPNVSSEYVVVGTGDLNGDGNDDIVWRSTTSRQYYVWYMTPVSNSKPKVDIVYMFTTNEGWSSETVADFNGDGKSDLFFRNLDHRTGVMLMDGSRPVSEAVMQSVLTTKYFLAGSGDLNGDGKGDIVWRDRTNGENYVWLMNGTASPRCLISPDHIPNHIPRKTWRLMQAWAWLPDLMRRLTRS